MLRQIDITIVKTISKPCIHRFLPPGVLQDPAPSPQDIISLVQLELKELYVPDSHLEFQAGELCSNVPGCVYSADPGNLPKPRSVLPQYDCRR